MMAAVACNAMEREYRSCNQPTNGAMAANISRITKLRMESTVARISEKVIWLMYPFNIGVANPLTM